jgi:hypothetical protein
VSKDTVSSSPHLTFSTHSDSPHNKLRRLNRLFRRPRLAIDFYNLDAGTLASGSVNVPSQVPISITISQPTITSSRFRINTVTLTSLVKRAAQLGLLLCSILLFSQAVFAATHYVDYSAGSDANDGMTKATPWKHSLGMPACTSNCAAYSPSGGDKIIFRGGVTWSSASLPLSASHSGSNGNNIYYGVDPTWYTGTNSGTVNTSGATVFWASGKAFQVNGSWTGGSITINGTPYTIASVQSPYALTLTASAGSQAGVSYSNSLFVRPIWNGDNTLSGIFSTDSGVSYITVDSIEMTGMHISADDAEGNIYIGGATSGNIVLNNLDVHNWTTSASTNSGSGGGIYAAMFGGLSPTNMILENSNVGNPENGGNIGACSRGFQQIINNYLHDCSQACLHGCSLVHDNRVNNVGNTFDPNEHTNGFYSDCFDQQCSGGLTSATAYIYNNYITNMGSNANATAIYPNPGTSGVQNSVSYYVFNNVVGGGGSDIGDEIDPYNGNGLTMNVYDWNNTYHVRTGGTCVNAVARSGLSLNVVDVRNLHCISDSGGTAFNSGGASSPASSNLLLQSVTTANGQGYTGAGGWTPTSSSGSTVGAGTNLASHCSGALTALCSDSTAGDSRATKPRPSSGSAWDIGAYQFVGTGPSPASGLVGVVH